MPRPVMLLWVIPTDAWENNQCCSMQGTIEWGYKWWRVYTWPWNTSSEPPYKCHPWCWLRCLQRIRQKAKASFTVWHRFHHDSPDWAALNAFLKYLVIPIYFWFSWSPCCATQNCSSEWRNGKRLIRRDVRNTIWWHFHPQYGKSFWRLCRRLAHGVKLTVLALCAV